MQTQRKQKLSEYSTKSYSNLFFFYINFNWTKSEINYSTLTLLNSDVKNELN